MDNRLLTTPYNGYYADSFRISGTFNGAFKTYDLYLHNPFVVKGTPNSTPRQFSLITVPESGSLALLLPAIGVLVPGWLRRRAKNQEK